MKIVSPKQCLYAWVISIRIVSPLYFLPDSGIDQHSKMFKKRTRPTAVRPRTEEDPIEPVASGSGSNTEVEDG